MENAKMLYENEAKEEYRKLMEVIELRSLRAAMMNYEVAADYDWSIYYMEWTSAVLGVIGTTAVLVQCINWTFKQLDRFGKNGFVIGVVVVALALLLHVIAVGSVKILPSLRSRAEVHNKAAASWQCLQLKTGSCLIVLRDPGADVSNYTKCYDDLIQMRKEICMMANVPMATYIKYENVSYVKERFGGRERLNQQLAGTRKSKLCECERNEKCTAQDGSHPQQPLYSATPANDKPSMLKP